MSLPRWSGPTLVFLVLAGVVGAACGTGGPPAQVPGPRAATPLPAPAGEAVPGVAVGGEGAEATGRAIPPVTEAEGLRLEVPRLGPRVVKTATVSIEIRGGTFSRQFQEATLVASRHGGFVASSQLEGGRRRSGVLVIRVPADEYEAALAELRGLGTVKGETLHGEDVTAQFVDLEARLRNWEAQERVLLRLMAQARTIEDSIRVQRVLQDVQLAIEEIRGQLRVLEDQTSFATITVQLTEAGFVPPRPKEEPALVRAWRAALRGFLAVVSAVVVGLGYLLPVALLSLAAFGLWLGYRRLRARATPAPADPV
jgi:hypothetical protein